MENLCLILPITLGYQPSRHVLLNCARRLRSRKMGVRDLNSKTLATDLPSFPLIYWEFSTSKNTIELTWPSPIECAL